MAAHLAKKELLFVLDNWDQITAAAETFCEQLLATEAVHLHSLVQRVAAGRYDLHPLVQEFAARKVDPVTAPLLVAAHSLHYLTLLTNTEAPQRATLRIDFENIRSAWQRAALATDAALIEPHVASFAAFITQFGGMVDGNMLFAEAVDHFDGSPAQQELVAHLLVEQTPFVRGLHGLPALCPLQQRVLTLTKNPKLQATAHFNLANHYAEQGEWTDADFHFDQTEALVVWEPMQHPNRYEAVGRAICRALAVGQRGGGIDLGRGGIDLCRRGY